MAVNGRSLSLLVFACIASLGLTCGQEPSNPSVVGTWNGLMNLATLVGDDVRIRMDIGEDRRYELATWYDRSGDTALVHRGTWELTGDSIYLAGSDCAVIDTAAGEMKPVPCEDTVAVYVDIEDDIWTVYLRDLDQIAVGLGFDPSDPTVKALLSPGSNLSVQLAREN